LSDRQTESGDEVSIRPVSAAGDELVFVKTLFVEYAESLEFAICFEGFDRELETLPGAYVPPGGNLWLARVGTAVAGCVALRPDAEPGVAEIKRLYVRPGFRGHRLGGRLTRTALGFAEASGYRTARLDTMVGRMREAQAIYRQLGFEVRPAPPGRETDRTVFYEKPLAGAGADQ
jgi:ribosomal protein S18 acetylase RimI-like enzyme